MAVITPTQQGGKIATQHTASAHISIIPSVPNKKAAHKYFSTIDYLLI
jgi:hypothetical protein